MKTGLQALVIFGISSSLAVAGNLTGKVNFKGTPPKQAALKMNADPGCVKANSGKTVLDESVSVNANKTLKNVFVYVKEGVKNAPPADMTPVSFDQQGCTYHPRIFAVRPNQPIKIINSDPLLHNVHALPKANSPFNMGMATKGQVIEKKFSKPEIGIKIKCDVHGWMLAYAHVVDHPYFAVTDAQGNFSIAGLPAGDYVVETVHEKLGKKTEKVTVTDAGKAVEFSY